MFGFKKRKSVIGWKNVYAASMLLAQHPRLGSASPVSLLDQFLHRQIMQLSDTFLQSVDREWVERPGETVVSNKGRTLKQIPDCTNFVSIANPPVEDGTAAYWDFTIDFVGSGTMRFEKMQTAAASPSHTPLRYAGVHRSGVVQPATFNPDFHIGIINGTAYALGTQLWRCGEFDLRKGSVIGIFVNRTDDDFVFSNSSFVLPHSMVFFFNGHRVAGGQINLPRKVPLWPAITLQTENDQVTARWDSPLPEVKKKEIGDMAGTSQEPNPPILNAYPGAVVEQVLPPFVTVPAPETSRKTRLCAII